MPKDTYAILSDKNNSSEEEGENMTDYSEQRRLLDRNGNIGKRRESRYDAIEYMKKIGPFHQFLLCKEAIHRRDDYPSRTCSGGESNDKEVQKHAKRGDQNVMKVFMGGISRFIRYVATEHGVLLEVLMWLPLLVMVFYIIFIEKGSIIV